MSLRILDWLQGRAEAKDVPIMTTHVTLWNMHLYCIDTPLPLLVYDVETSTTLAVTARHTSIGRQYMCQL